MIRERINQVRIFRFPGLSGFKGVKHGVFARKGGVSPEPFDSLNVGFSVGDSDGNVRENRRIMNRCFGSGRTVYLEQVHSDTVVAVTGKNRRALLQEDASAPRGDAAVTELAGLNLAIQVADCQSVLLFDPRRRVVANVHSGWRGSIRNIVGKTIEYMVERFRVNPRDIRAGIGPSLGPCCAEFVNYKDEIPEKFWKYRDRGQYFDFWAISRDQMILRGVLAENVETAGICTRCATDLFYSYRAEKVTGRFAAMIALV